MNCYLINVTMVRNQADGDGGAIRLADGHVYLRNAILWGNSTPQISIQDQSLTASYSIVEGGEAGISHVAGGTISWLTGNVDADPQLDANDRPLTGSPAIDAGDDSYNTLTMALGETDRVIDGDQDGTATIDIGAYGVRGPGGRQSTTSANHDWKSIRKRGVYTIHKSVSK